MLFNSFNFLTFFVLVTTAYFLLPHRWRWVLLLAASCYFYMAFVPLFILILFFTITVDYIAGIAIEESEGKRRKLFLTLSILANIGVLFVFKYFNFFNQNIAELANFLNWNYSLESLSLILPIGLSFHVFQSLAYTIEVYRGNQKAERHLGIFALYVMFYPQLVAGPIERPQNLLHQFKENHYFDFSRIGRGLELMLYGYFKKLVIADNLAIYVNAAYSNPAEYSGLSIAIATVFFAFQIYCDFSGYSDIALGAAEVMGIRMMTNFRRPYFSRTIAEFWRSWHISLSTWFKDYVYVSLGGNHGSHLRVARNLMITFVLSGLWHGANWTYVVWGALNGMYLIIGKLTYSFRERLFATQSLVLTNVRKFGATLFTFILICIAWVFFRAETISDALLMIKKMFTDWQNISTRMTSPDFISQEIFLNFAPYDFYWCVAGITILLIAEFCALKEYDVQLFTNERPFLKWTIKWLILSTEILLIIVLTKSTAQQFIYFQF